MIMTMELWMWVLIGVGCVPWLVSRRRVSVGRGRRQRWTVKWEVRALFWRLAVERPQRGKACWRLRIVLFERVQQAVWEAVGRLVR